MRTKKVETLPDEMTVLADDLSAMLSGVSKSGPLPSRSGWADTEGDLPEDVEQWTTKDFVKWFASQCRTRLDIPFSPLYVRDCPLIKTLLADFKKIGREKSDLRDFLDWTFEHKDRIVKMKSSFTLNSIRYFLNDFLQAGQDTPDTEVHHPRRDLMVEMTEEKRGGMAHMLQKYGVPAVAAYALAMYRDRTDLDKVERQVTRVIDEAVGRGDFEFVRLVARSSQDGSPYPSDFPLRDWRVRFAGQWRTSKCHAQPWWQEEDHTGKPLVEYADLKVSETDAEI